VHQIYSALQSGKKHGMQTMNDSLYQLQMTRRVNPEECLRVSPDPKEFMRMIGMTPPEEEDIKSIDEGRRASLRR